MSIKTTGPTLKGRLIALAVGLVLATVISEAVLRSAMPHWREFFSGWFMHSIYVPKMGWVRTGKPGFDGYFAQNNGDFRVRIKINARGFRDPEPAAKAAGQIWVIGDSMAFGWGVERNEMYSEVIARELGRPVYNVASPGADVCGYQRLYAHMPKKARPSVVVVGLILENDLANYDCATEDVDPTTKILEKEESVGWGSLSGIKQSLAKYSALYNFFSVSLKRVDIVNEALIKLGLVKSINVKRRAISPEKVKGIVEKTADELERLKQMIPANVPFVILMAPMRYELKYGDEGSRNMRQKMAAELASRGLNVIDPIKEFTKAGYKAIHFAHDGHWSARGHEIAGRKTARFLKKILADR